jgi:hypothetical protein
LRLKKKNRTTVLRAALGSGGAAFAAPKPPFLSNHNSQVVASGVGESCVIAGSRDRNCIVKLHYTTMQICNGGMHFGGILLCSSCPLVSFLSLHADFRESSANHGLLYYKDWTLRCLCLCLPFFYVDIRKRIKK